MTLPDGSRTDLFVDAGRLVDQRPLGATTVDADGLIALPGLVDIHTHLREPGREDAETVDSGSAPPPAGGFTAVFAMANTQPVTDTAENAEHVLALGTAANNCQVIPIGAITKELAGRELAELGLMHRSRARVSMFSDDGHCVMDASLMRRAFEWVKPFDGVLAQHAQDATLAGPEACCHEGEISGRLGLPGWPPVAESVIIARDVALAEPPGPACTCVTSRRRRAWTCCAGPRSGASGDRRGHPPSPVPDHPGGRGIRHHLQGQSPAAHRRAPSICYQRPRLFLPKA